MTKEQINEFSLRISQSNKTQIVVITYEIIHQYIESAKEALAQGQTEEFAFNVKKARQFVGQLSSALDFQYGISRELMQIYLFVNDCLLKSELRRQDVHLSEVSGIMAKLQSAFEEVSKQDTSLPQMQGGSTVYEGLTYGKNGLGTIMVSK